MNLLEQTFKPCDDSDENKAPFIKRRNTSNEGFGIHDLSSLSVESDIAIHDDINRILST